ncbi:MAG: hypothetical protein JEZ11_14865 [Desulfobacterales bacterium]|nr:hypothetical protein [Desulfobacterales bacterium]
MIDKEAVFQKAFIDPIHRNGRGTMLAAVVCLFLPGLYLAFFHGMVPDPGTLMGALLAVWAIFVVIGLIEPVVYYPMLGFGGTYMSFLVGNVLNLRVPVAMTAQEVVGTRPGTPEAEVVSTLGIAGSMISCQLVLIVGMLAFLPFIDGLKESGTSLSLALDQVLPALFGALGGIYILKNPKLAAVPLVLGLGIALIKDNIPYSVVIPPMVIISVATARHMYKKGWVSGDEMG